MLLYLFLFEIGLASAQDEVMHSQSVVKQEYLNPAYSSFKDYVSVNLLSRTQWVGVTENPRVYGANVYVPLQLSRMGVGLTVLNEDIGLRNVSSVNVSLAHNIRVGLRSYLSFGYGVGAELTAYDRDQIIAKNEEYLLYNIDWSIFNPAIKLGLFYTDPHFFIGMSSNSVLGKADDKNWYLPGIDFVCGAMYQINQSLFFRPDLIVKYYRNEQITVQGTNRYKTYVPPVLDLSLSFLLDDRLWLSTSHRLNQAQTFSADILIARSLQLGYSFELGLGAGINQFNTHAISLSFRIGNGFSLQGFQREVRYNMGAITNYLYR